MRIRVVSENLLEVTAARHELSALLAGARMALRLLEEDPAAPGDARDALARVVGAYDAALREAGSGEPKGGGPRPGDS
jgi:hypothetical protein